MCGGESVSNDTSPVKKSNKKTPKKTAKENTVLRRHAFWQQDFMTVFGTFLTLFCSRLLSSFLCFSSSSFTFFFFFYICFLPLCFSGSSCWAKKKTVWNRSGGGFTDDGWRTRLQPKQLFSFVFNISWPLYFKFFVYPHRTDVTKT